MTVSTTTNKITYAGNGATTVFPFSFATPATPADIEVIYVDPSGNVSTISPSAYTLVFNAPTSSNPTPVGGTVTYNPGSPIPVGSSLTILRILPLQQNTSLSNQTSLFQQTIEGALDYVTMLCQQIFTNSQAIQVPATDPPPATLPPVAQRANLIMGFDSGGNPIATNTIPTGGSISSAMAPVCSANTLATARTNLGLGNIAVENIGVGLEDDGTGNLIVDCATVSVTISQGVTKAEHMNHLFCSGGSVGSLTFTQANGYFNGFRVVITNSTVLGITLNINGVDSFSGLTAGQSTVIPAGGVVEVTTNGQNPGIWFVTPLGNVSNYTTIANYSLQASVASSALTIALKDASGNDPSATSPVYIGFGGNGSLRLRAVINPLAITVPTGATLGTQNGIPARIWVGMASADFGLAVYNAVAQSSPSAVSSILCWNEALSNTCVFLTASATSAQQWYTSTGSSPQQIRILGYVEITTPTAGTWTVSPSLVAVYGPASHKPGDCIQEVPVLLSASTTTSATYAALTSENVNLTMQNAADIVKVQASGAFGLSGAGTGALRMSRGTTNNTNLIGSEATAVFSSAAQSPVSLMAFDMPGSGSFTYAIQGKTTAGTLTANTNMQMVAQEIFA